MEQFSAANSPLHHSTGRTLHRDTAIWVPHGRHAGELVSDVLAVYITLDRGEGGEKAEGRGGVGGLGNSGEGGAAPGVGESWLSEHCLAGESCSWLVLFFSFFGEVLVLKLTVLQAQRPRQLCATRNVGQFPPPWCTMHKAVPVPERSQGLGGWREAAEELPAPRLP